MSQAMQQVVHTLHTDTPPDTDVHELSMHSPDAQAALTDAPTPPSNEGDLWLDAVGGTPPTPAANVAASNQHSPVGSSNASAAPDEPLAADESRPDSMITAATSLAPASSAKQKKAPLQGRGVKQTAAPKVSQTLPNQTASGHTSHEHGPGMSWHVVMPKVLALIFNTVISLPFGNRHMIGGHVCFRAVPGISGQLCCSCKRMVCSCRALQTLLAARSAAAVLAAARLDAPGAQTRRARAPLARRHLHQHIQRMARQRG